jgi:hypothetical protein
MVVAALAMACVGGATAVPSLLTHCDITMCGSNHNQVLL